MQKKPVYAIIMLGMVLCLLATGCTVKKNATGVQPVNTAEEPISETTLATESVEIANTETPTEEMKPTQTQGEIQESKLEQTEQPKATQPVETEPKATEPTVVDPTLGEEPPLAENELPRM